MNHIQEQETLLPEELLNEFTVCSYSPKRPEKSPSGRPAPMYKNPISAYVFTDRDKYSWPAGQSPLGHSVHSRLAKSGQTLQLSHTLCAPRDISHEGLPKSFRRLTYAPLPFLLLEDGALDGWMGEQIEGHSRKRRQFHFPSATLVQHQQAFHSLTYFCLFFNNFSSPAGNIQYQHVSISVNRG